MDSLFFSNNNEQFNSILNNWKEDLRYICIHLIMTRENDIIVYMDRLCKGER